MIYNYFKFIKAKNPKANVVFTHGIALYSNNYLEFLEKIKEKGYNILVYDVRGHGHNKEERGFISGFEVAVSDLSDLIEFVNKDNDLPVYLMGHSMGGLITNIYTSIYDNFDGIIILASPFKFPLSQRFLLKFLPLFKINSIATNYADKNLSKLPPIDDSDPLLLKEFSMSFVNNLIIKGTDYYLKNIGNNKKPILLIYGTKDKMASYKKANIYLNKMKMKDKRLVLINNAYHNLHHEVETDEVVDTIVSWLDDKIK